MPVSPRQLLSSLILDLTTTSALAFHPTTTRDTAALFHSLYVAGDLHNERVRNGVVGHALAMTAAASYWAQRFAAALPTNKTLGRATDEQIGDFQLYSRLVDQGRLLYHDLPLEKKPTLKGLRFDRMIRELGLIGDISTLLLVAPEGVVVHIPHRYLTDPKALYPAHVGMPLALFALLTQAEHRPLWEAGIEHEFPSYLTRKLPEVSDAVAKIATAPLKLAAAKLESSKP